MSHGKLFFLHRTWGTQPFLLWPTNRTWRAQWQQPRSPSASRLTRSQHTRGTSKPAVPWQERGESVLTKSSSASSKVLSNTPASLPLQPTCQSRLDEVTGCCQLKHSRSDGALNRANLISTALSTVVDSLQYSLNTETTIRPAAPRLHLRNGRNVEGLWSRNQPHTHQEMIRNVSFDWDQSSSNITWNKRRCNRFYFRTLEHILP